MTLLTPKELEALKAMAAANIESALMAAARAGATKAPEAAKHIKRAVEILETDAEEMKQCCCHGGEWIETDYKQDYDEKKRVARALRGMLE